MVTMSYTEHEIVTANAGQRRNAQRPLCRGADTRAIARGGWSREALHAEAGGGGGHARAIARMHGGRPGKSWCAWDVQE